MMEKCFQLEYRRNNQKSSSILEFPLYHFDGKSTLLNYHLNHLEEPDQIRIYFHLIYRGKRVLTIDWYRFHRRDEITKQLMLSSHSFRKNTPNTVYVFEGNVSIGQGKLIHYCLTMRIYQPFYGCPVYLESLKLKKIGFQGEKKRIVRCFVYKHCWKQ